MSISSATEPGSVNGLQPYPKKGKPKGSRLADARSLQKIYERFRQLDEKSAYQRMGVRAMINGQAPYKEAALRKAGRAASSNLNFGEAKAKLRQMLTNYNGLMEGTQTLVALALPDGLLDDATKTLVQDVVANEFTVMLKEWDDFETLMQILFMEFVTHGVALAYHPDDDDWRFDVAGWDDFWIPRDTRVSESKVDVLIIYKPELPSDMAARIEDEESASEMGWNADAVRDALVRCTTTAQNGQRWTWADLQRQLKSNDLYTNHSEDARMHTLHGYVREYDSTFSHYIIERDGLKPSDKAELGFLYDNVSSEDSPKQFFTLFRKDVGDGTFHTVRGAGYDMYPHIQTSNKAWNAMVDNLMLSMKIMLQPGDESAMESPPVQLDGPVVVLSPDWEFIPRDFPNHTNGALPIMHDLAIMMGSMTDGGSPQSLPASVQPQTKYGIQAAQTSGTSLAVDSVNMAYQGLRRMLREVFRRAQVIVGDLLSGAEDPEDHPEIVALMERCAAQGVDPRLISEINRVDEKRVIGAGSPGAKQAIMDRMLSRIGTMDEIGRAQLLHDMDVLDVGVQAAQRYRPATAKPRPVIDQKVAQLENSGMFQGTAIEPLDGENHSVHASVHIQAIGESIKALEDWRNGGEEGDITALQPHIAFLSLLIPHAERHVAALEGDPTRAQEFGAYKKALQEFAATWMTYVRQLEKAISEQQEEENAKEQPDPEQIAKLEKFKLDMEMSVQKFQTEQQIKVAESMQKMELEKRKVDSKLAGEQMKRNMELAEALDSASSSGVVTNSRSHTPAT